MNKQGMWMLMVVLGLMGCQQEQADSDEGIGQVAHHETAAANTAVAVTKPEVSHIGQNIGKAMDDMTAQADVQALQAEVQPVAKPEVAVSHAGETGDVHRGASLAKQCAMCHTFTDKRKLGPGLQGIMGRKVGVMPDMKYSPDLASGTWVWNAEQMAMWVCDAKEAVKSLSKNPDARTKMPALHLCNPEKQADLIAFLRTL